jgi:hypothetical protein
MHVSSIIFLFFWEPADTNPDKPFMYINANLEKQWSGTGAGTTTPCLSGPEPECIPVSNPVQVQDPDPDFGPDPT